MGRRVEISLAGRDTTWSPSAALEWAKPDLVSAQINQACADFADQVADGPWQVVWCAGAGVVGSGQPELDQETSYLSHLLGGLARSMRPKQLSAGQFFLASSAGGVYAGSPSSPPYSEHSEPSPLAPYGFNKLRQESIVRRWSADTGAPAMIGRLSNIYGPGQKLAKSQGVISHVCRCVLFRQPFMLYVSPDTLRDYLYVDDAAFLIAAGLDRLRREHTPGTKPSVVVKVLACGRASTIATILGEVRRVAKAPVRVMIVASPNERHQAADLRMTSVEWTELDGHSKTTLAAGIRMVINDILDGLQRGARS